MSSRYLYGQEDLRSSLMRGVTGIIMLFIAVLIRRAKFPWLFKQGIAWEDRQHGLHGGFP